MMTLAKKTTGSLVAAGALVAGGAGVAMAQDATEWTDYGMSVSVGGGIQNFTNERMRDTTSLGGMWDVRIAFGTTSPVGVEAAYVGSATPIDALFDSDESATLIGTSVEGLIRINLMPTAMVTPYAFGGLAWQRYDIRGEDFRTADTGIRDEDTLLAVPVGGGLSYRYYGFLADARFTYRAAIGEDLVIDSDDVSVPDLRDDTGSAALDTWSVSARLGYEF